jgi:hypothetical protein
MAATKKMPTTPEATIVRVKRETALFPIVGTTPLITHAWSEKAKQEMRDKQTGKAKPKKDAKDPEADFQASKYRLPDGREAFPAVAFKAAIVNAARLFEGITMTELRQTVYVHGEGPNLLVPIQVERNDDVGIRELHPVRLEGGKRSYEPIDTVMKTSTLRAQMSERLQAEIAAAVNRWVPLGRKVGLDVAAIVTAAVRQVDDDRAA